MARPASRKAVSSLPAIANIDEQLDEVVMKILIGRWESGGDWKSVILGVFENEEIAKDTEKKFQRKHEGHNYYKTEYVDADLNKPLPF